MPLPMCTGALIEQKLKYIFSAFYLRIGLSENRHRLGWTVPVFKKCGKNNLAIFIFQSGNTGSLYPVQ